MKANGAAVDATKLKYWLYYAKVGVTSNSVTVSGDTTAADVVKAVGNATGTDDKAKGRIEALANNLATGFTLGGLTATHTYRYTVVVIHPNGTINSTPAPAQTSEAVRATPSQATAPPVPTLNTPNPKTNTGFTVTWNDPDLTTAKKDTGESLLVEDVGYVVYYTSATTEPTAEAVKIAGSENTPTSGKVPVDKGDSKTASVTGKAFVHTVYMVLEAINTTDTSKTKLSEITKYAVTGAATSPTVPTVNLTPGEDQLTVQVTALTTGFGTTTNGTPLDADTVRYIFYYAKKDQAIGDKTAEAATADDMYDALKALTTNTANKGKVTLTTTTGIGRPKAVTGLTPGGEYHYTVRVQETAAPANGSNTTKAKTNTSSAAKATGNPPNPAFSTTAGANTHTGFTTGNIVAAPMDTAKKADGEAVNPDGRDVEYKLYYVSSTDALTTPTQVKEAALTASQTADDNTGGVKDATVGSPVTVTDKAFTGTVYAVVEAIIKTDTGKRALSGVASYKVTGAAAAGTSGTAPSIAAEEVSDNPGKIQLTLTPPTDWGTRDDGGTPVDKKDINLWLFYREDTAGDKTKQNIIADIADAAVHTTDLAAPNTTRGVIQIAPPDTIRATYPFVITGLKAGTQYSFFLRIIHPDSTVGTKANERTKYARDTAVAHGTSAPEGWYVSTLATGFNGPQGIAAASDGTLYVADSGNHLIKKLTLKADGTFEAPVIIAGDGTEAYKNHDTGILAQFNFPIGIALAPDGKSLYVADTTNKRIRMIALAAPYAVSSIPGSFRNDGIAVAPDGNTLYITDVAGGIIRKLTLPRYTVSIISSLARGLNSPSGIAVTKDALYVTNASSLNGFLKKITLKEDGSFEAMSTIASGFNNPHGIAITPDGTLYVADSRNHLIKKITLKEDGSFEAMSTIAGSTQGNTNGIGTDAQFSSPQGIAAAKDKDGNTLLYVADIFNHSIRKLEYKAKED